MSSIGEFARKALEEREAVTQAAEKEKAEAAVKANADRKAAEDLFNQHVAVPVRQAYRELKAEKIDVELDERRYAVRDLIRLDFGHDLTAEAKRRHVVLEAERKSSGEFVIAVTGGRALARQWTPVIEGLPSDIDAAVRDAVSRFLEVGDHGRKGG